jgi:hypothetical protein
MSFPLTRYSIWTARTTTRDLPIFALVAVTGLDDEVRDVLGVMIMFSLRVASKASHWR